MPTLPHPTPTNPILLKQGFDSNNLPLGLNPGAIALNQASSLTIYAKGTGPAAAHTTGVNLVSFATENGDEVTVVRRAAERHGGPGVPAFDPGRCQLGGEGLVDPGLQGQRR